MKSKITYKLILIVFLPFVLLAQVENWIYTYDGPGNSADVVNSVINGGDGNMYAAGYSTGWGTNADFTVISLKPDGDTNWTYTYNGPGNSSDQANSITYGDDGNLYAAGVSYGEDTYADFTVISLTTQGDTNWTYRYDGPAHGTDRASSIIYGDDGNIYAAGNCAVSSLTDYKFFVVSLDTEGDTNWTYTYGPGSIKGSVHSITYGDGNIYAAGDSRGGNYEDFTVISLDTLGNNNWTYTYNGSADRYDRANSLICGDDNNIYAAGYCTISGNGEDFTVISLRRIDGHLNWMYSYDGPAGGNDQANSIIYGDDGNIYAAGYSRGIGTGQDFTVISLNTVGGPPNWIYRYNGPADSTDIGNSIIYGADDNIYAAGYSIRSGTGQDFTVISLDTLSNNNWIYWYNGLGDNLDAAGSVIYGADGNIYAAGYSMGIGTGQDFTVISLDTTLYTGDVEPISIDVDSLVPGNTKLLPQATVTNCGPHTETFEVTCEIDPGPYASTDTIIDLVPGDTIPITFPDTCLFETGSYTVKVYTQLRRDVNIANDTLEMVVLVDDIPPVPFSLISPLDSTMFSNPRPIFIWESSSDLLSGFRDYEFYIDDVLEHTGIDTAWTPDIDVQEGWHNWYVIAYDSFGNQQYSTETWSVLIDTTIPSIVTLISPADGAYLNDGTINFVWNKASDNLSGIDDYVLQYSQDNTFSSGVVETIVVDTTFSTVLSDTIWYWHVKARDKANNESDWSSIWNFEIDTETPDVPTLFSPVAGIWLNDTIVMFEWAEVMNLTETARRMYRVNSNRESDKTARSQVNYIIQVDTLSDFVSPFIVDTLNETSTTIVLSENFYYWRVKTFDMAGNQSSYAGPDSFGVDMTIPVIESTTVWSDTSFAGPFEIKTKITDNLSGVDSVLLYYRRDEDPDWVSIVMMRLSEEPGWFLELIPTVSNPADTVRYYIRAVDRSETGNVVTDPETAPAEYYWFLANYNPGVMEHGDIPSSFSFGLQSNPARGKAVFNLALPHDAIIKLHIYDVSGRLIDNLISERKSAGFHKIPWSSEISSGIYFYKFESPWENKVGKLVLVR
jgi:hypothetical protein